MIVASACNEDYIPGVLALFASFKQHNAGRFVVLFQGCEEGERRLIKHGIEVIRNPDIPLRAIPQTRNRPESTALVHCYRLAIPELLGKAIYIDADSLVLRNLTPLWELEFDQPIAATESNAPLRKEIYGKGVPDIVGFISSLLVFNAEAWKSQRIIDRCDAASVCGLEFQTGDQALMNWALIKNWHKLPIQTQAHVGHRTIEKYPADEVFTLHFLGTNPWDEVPQHLLPYPDYKLKAREMWREYYSGIINAA